MKRRIIEIDQEKCNGCGACAKACHEGAISMVDGKAKLMRDDYCDGLGDCLPNCPTGAITFVEREAAAYDEQAVIANKQKKQEEMQSKMRETMKRTGMSLSGGCPGSKAMSLNHAEHETGGGCPGSRVRMMAQAETDGADAAQSAARYRPMQPVSRLAQWPVQIKLVPVSAPFYAGARLLIAADCTAYAYAAFHEDFIKGHITLIGCPKLDSVDYSEKLTQIIAGNDIKSVTIVRMEVPCCGGLENAAKTALQNSGKFIPWQVVTISTDGKILD